MTITSAAGLAALALAILAHGFVQRLTPGPVASVVGWIIVALAIIAICSQFVHCNT